MRVVSNDARLERAVQRVKDASAQGTHIDALMDACADAIAEVAPWDAVFLSAADPHSGQFTATRCVRELPVPMCAPWVRNEFLEADVNKFGALVRHGRAVSTIGEATRGEPMRSPRFRDIYRPHGMGHELRAALADATGCWGYLTLVREHGGRDFDDTEKSLVERLAPTIASAVRRSHAGTVLPAPITTGAITVSPSGDIVQVTDGARPALDEVCAASVLAVAASALAHAHGRGAPDPLTRVRTSDGSWMSMRGDVVRDGDEAVAAVVIIEPSTARDLFPVLTAAYGLTPRETEVLRHVASGETTIAIGTALELSPYTVRDHLSAIFAKVGVHSRGELVHALFGLDTVAV